MLLSRTSRSQRISRAAAALRRASTALSHERHLHHTHISAFADAIHGRRIHFVHLPTNFRDGEMRERFRHLYVPTERTLILFHSTSSSLFFGPCEGEAGKEEREGLAGVRGVSAALEGIQLCTFSYLWYIIPAFDAGDNVFPLHHVLYSMIAQRFLTTSQV